MHYVKFFLWNHSGKLWHLYCTFQLLPTSNIIQYYLHRVGMMHITQPISIILYFLSRPTYCCTWYNIFFILSYFTLILFHYIFILFIIILFRVSIKYSWFWCHSSLWKEKSIMCAWKFFEVRQLITDPLEITA